MIIGELQVVELRKLTKEESIVKVVEKSDLRLIIIELRLRLILEGITKELIAQRIFNDYDNNNSITIHELARILRRKPVKCIQDTIKLARYIIEPRKSAHNKYNEKLSIQVGVVTKQLAVLLEQYVIFNEEKEKFVTKGISQVLFIQYSRNVQENLRKYLR